MAQGLWTILVVDDDERVGTVVADMARSVGFQVLTAVGARAALDLFESAQPTIDALLTDFQMPEIDGEELIRLIRAKSPDLPAVIMTGYAERLSPGYDVLEKPFAMASLERVLRCVLQRTAKADGRTSIAP